MIEIALVGDTHRSNRAMYHVGGEAAFNEVERRLADEVAAVSTRDVPHHVPDATVALSRLRDARPGTTDESATLVGDVLWFVGGGCLNSLFQNYLYHRLWLIREAKAAGKVVILTSQTLGPFEAEDRELFRSIIPSADHLSVRDRAASMDEVAGLDMDVMFTHDDAAYLEYKPLPRSKGRQVGVSLRDWDGSESVAAAQQVLRMAGPDEVHLIPHLLGPADEYDNRFMWQRLPGQRYPYQQLMASGQRCDRYVKALTARLDILITTRYHGAVFASATGVKCIAIFADDYFERKMRGLLDCGVSNLLLVDARRFDSDACLRFINHTASSEWRPSLPSTKEVLERACSAAACRDTF